MISHSFSRSSGVSLGVPRVLTSLWKVETAVLIWNTPEATACVGFCLPLIRFRRPDSKSWKLIVMQAYHWVSRENRWNCNWNLVKLEEVLEWEWMCCWWRRDDWNDETRLWIFILVTSTWTHTAHVALHVYTTPKKIWTEAFNYKKKTCRKREFFLREKAQFFFYWSSNLRTCIYYILFIPT